MSEEKPQDWNKKRILITIIGVAILAAVLALTDNVLIAIGTLILGGVTAAMQDTIKQIIKDLFSLFLKSDSANDNSMPSAGKSTINFGRHTQVGQIGDYNTQHNNIQIINQGITDIALAKQLGITETALLNFFKILEHRSVPAAELDDALRKLATCHKELEERVKQLDSEDPEVIALQKQAREAITNAQYEQAEDLLDKAAALDNSAAEKINAVYLKRKRSAAENMALKAKTLHTHFAWNDAIKAYQQAIGFAEEAKAEERMAEYQNSLGRVYHDNGQYKEAIIYYEQALASDLRTYGGDHPTVAIRRNNLGLSWNDLGQYNKAIGYYEQALASDLKTYGNDHPNAATYRNNLGEAWRALGQYNKAIGYYEQALASDLKTYGEYHPNIATDHNNLGAAYDSLGQYDKAIKYYKQALVIDRDIYGEDHPSVARDLNNLGSAWDSLEQYDKATGYFEQALSILTEKLGSEHPHTLLVSNNLKDTRKALADKTK